MDWIQWIALWSLIGTQAGTAIGIYKYFDGRINNVFKRLDEIKDHVNTHFVAKDICKVLHANTAANLIGTEVRMNVRFDKLEKRVEDSFNMIIDMLKK